jgi:hypothetical protein
MVQDDIQAIVSSLRPEDRDYVRNLPEDDLIRLHRTFGRSLRNAFRSHTYGDLFRYCSQQVNRNEEKLSFDSISAIAIRLIWDYLRSTTEAEPSAAADGPGPSL